MKKLILSFCLFISLASSAQIQFDSCYVYKVAEKKEIKESELLYEFFQMSCTSSIDKLSPTDLQTLNTAINRATNMTFAIPKIPVTAFFMRCHAKKVVYGFAILSDKHVMVDAARNVKLVFENKEDIEFLNKLGQSYGK